ncbi:hypothetical protein PPUN12996_19460 [Pseudomonas putida]|uniref:SMI1/KNR4 family protein n=1 Tax=Pseudomonas asiatica TaxID=2219225 RepID=UPI00206077AC|nr:SMI1/KNR4 family protein [Pseudomonas sp. A2]GLO29890.1 hypothetical protein PPUN12996_19460 [Pseudomonas putida]
MDKKKLFAHNDITLNDSLPGLSINSLKHIFPNNFPGRDSLISFYSTYNGGYFDGGAYIYREDIYTLKPDDYNLLEIEAFNFIPAHPNQTHSRLMSTTEKLDLRIIHHKANSCFLSKNIPFAGDAGANDFWIDTATGVIRYTRSEHLSDPSRAILVAPNFRTFLDAIRGSRKP